MNSEPESSTEYETTGLPWPKTWTGAYLLVLCSFVCWVVLLAALGASF